MNKTSIPWCDATWATVPSWPTYGVSPDGRIRNQKTKKALKLRRHETNGHLYFLPRRGRKCYAHRAVLEAFVGMCPPGKQCRHLDGDPTNNYVGNLCWGTPTENAADKKRHGTQPHGETSAQAKLTNREVIEIRALRGAMSIRSVARKYGISHTAVRRVMTRKTWSHIKEASCN